MIVKHEYPLSDLIRKIIRCPMELYCFLGNGFHKVIYICFLLVYLLSNVSHGQSSVTMRYSIKGFVRDFDLYEERNVRKVTATLYEVNSYGKQKMIEKAVQQYSKSGDTLYLRCKYYDMDGKSIEKDFIQKKVYLGNVNQHVIISDTSATYPVVVYKIDSVKKYQIILKINKDTTAFIKDSICYNSKFKKVAIYNSSENYPYYRQRTYDYDKNGFLLNELRYNVNRLVLYQYDYKTIISGDKNIVTTYLVNDNAIIKESVEQFNSKGLIEKRIGYFSDLLFGNQVSKTTYLYNEFDLTSEHQLEVNDELKFIIKLEYEFY